MHMLTNRAAFDIAFLAAIFAVAMSAGDKLAMKMAISALILEGAGHIARDHEAPNGVANFLHFMALVPTMIAGIRVLSFL